MKKYTLNNFLQPDSKTLGSLLLKLNQLRQWNAWLKESLPDNELLTQHCFIANLKGTSLIVFADSAHWVTRLRFHIPELLKKLKNYPDLASIKAICCKTHPNHTSTVKKKKCPTQKLSTKTAELVFASAQKISDKKLREAVEKIALHKAASVLS